MKNDKGLGSSERADSETEVRGDRVTLVGPFVEVLEAKPNRMFTEDQRQLVRFLRYSRSVACAECGRKGKLRWTMLCAFQAWSMSAIVPKKAGTVHMPLTPVCTSHLLAPELTSTARSHPETGATIEPNDKGKP